MKAKKRIERWTKPLRDTYQALAELQRALDAPPAVREVVRFLGHNKDHISKVHGDLLRLEQMGLVRKLEISTRCFKAIGPPADEIDWEERIRSIS